MKIAFVTYCKSLDLTPSDKLLVKPLESFGHQVVAAPWDNPEIDWRQFDVLILRSCWNYHLKIDKFLRWLDNVSQLGIKLWNPYQIVRWNIDKKYLFELEKKGIAIIPTKLIKKNSHEPLENFFRDLTCQELVIKPVIGAMAENIIKVNEVEAVSKQKKFRTFLKQTDYLIQPLMPEIYQGEISMVFLGKKFSHAAIKRPKQGEFRVNYRFGGRFERTDLSGDVIDQAKKIIDKVKGNLLYARVDGIVRNGKFLLMELELVEPHLFLDLYPPSALQFASKFENLNK